MKVKVIIFALILFVIVICLPKQNQAYVGPPYFDRLGYPSEHPWQDVEYPPTDDILRQKVISGTVILVTPTRVIVIRASQIKSKSETTRQTLKKAEFGCPTTKGSD